ncbi:MAG TPA: hypothetical protein VH062_02480 [Polyangiaceae bacterium]|jgi:hypothetical protein|nr:hypothetical protein [Polyangiaceae bacterium]
MGHRANLRVVPATVPHASCPKCGERDSELFSGISCHVCSWFWVPTNEERAAFFYGRPSLAARVAYEIRRGRVGGVAFHALLRAGQIAKSIAVALRKAAS